MLVKVNSLKQVPGSSNSSLHLQSAPETSSQKSLPKPAIYAQPQSASQSPGATKQTPTGEGKQSMQIKKTENGGFCLVLMNGPASQTPPRSQTGTPQPASPKYASPAPIYDEPSLESPIYDEPPVDMDTESVGVSGMSPPRSPSNSLKKQLQPAKLLQHPNVQQQQAAKKHARNPSSTEYSPAGREYIKHMVNVDQSSKLSHSAAATADASTKLPGQLASKDSFKQSWRILEANVLKSIEAHHSRQNSLQTQEYPTAISHQDSGYSTGPSPSLRKRKGRRQGAGQGRPGSVGSSSELTALNDKLIAEMRAVVGRSAACRGSKASLDAQSLESGIPAESGKVRFQSDHLKKCINRSSRDDVSASNRSLYRQGLESRGGFPSDVAALQDTVRQKRTFEKVDSLEKNVTSRASLASSGATRRSSQVPPVCPRLTCVSLSLGCGGGQCVCCTLSSVAAGQQAAHGAAGLCSQGGEEVVEGLVCPQQVLCAAVVCIVARKLHYTLFCPLSKNLKMNHRVSKLRRMRMGQPRGLTCSILWQQCQWCNLCPLLKGVCSSLQVYCLQF